MKLSVLLGGLNNPNPTVRLDVVQVLGMLDETRALEPLRERYHQEDDEAVRQGITWAGKRLYQARQAGYSTIDEIFRYFNIDREIETTPDESEAKLMEQMDLALQKDLGSIREKGARGKVGWAIGVSMVAGMGAGVGALMTPGADLVSSGLNGRPQLGKRTPATLPTDADISIWLRRLNESDDPDRREQAIIQLNELNNPRALPHLANTFIHDAESKVRQAAQRYGKILYWRAIYWDMEQDGSLIAEMQRRANALGKNIKVEESSPMLLPGVPSLPGTQPAATPPPTEENIDVGDILMKAKAAREKRKSSRGIRDSKGRRR